MREGREGGGPFKRMDHAQLIQGFSDQTKVADAHFLVSVVELTPFLSISVCWFWFWLSQTRSGAWKRWGCWSEKVAELRVTGKTKFAILECKKFLKQLFLSS